MHFDEILSIRASFTIKMSEICIENKNLASKLVLDTIFYKKSLEQTLRKSFKIQNAQRVNALVAYKKLNLF